MKKTFFLGSLLLLALVGTGCASAAPAPAPITPDPVTPPGHWEMKVAEDQEEAPPPPPAEERETDKPNVASKAGKRSLFALPKKTKD